MKVVISHGFVSHFFLQVVFSNHPDNLTSSPPGNPQKHRQHQRCNARHARGARNCLKDSAVQNLRPIWVVPFVWKDFARILKLTTCFFGGESKDVFWGSSQKVTSWILVAWVRFNLWMAYLYHRLILLCEIQSLNSDVQSNHGFGISYILWSTYIYLADSMAIQGRCIPTKSDLYLVHVWNFQVYKVGSYRGL